MSFTLELPTERLYPFMTVRLTIEWMKGHDRTPGIYGIVTKADRKGTRKMMVDAAIKYCARSTADNTLPDIVRNLGRTPEMIIALAENGHLMEAANQIVKLGI